jgi:adenylosuccinate synthase
VYEELPGWEADLGEAERYQDLPPEAAAYVARIAELGGVPVRHVSVGPDRRQTLAAER